MRLAVSSLFLLLVMPGTTFAQLEGRFYLDKDKYVSGEPVYLNFALTNTGKESIRLTTGNLFTPCGGYEIRVSRSQKRLDWACPTGYAGSCIAATRTLLPGETATDRILLNYGHDFSQPDTYVINATRIAEFGPVTGDLPRIELPQRAKFESQLGILVLEGREVDLVPVFQPLVDDLNSKVEARRLEAAMAIGSIAPSFLEETILSMLDQQISRRFPLMGLRKLNTPRCREALAEIVQVEERSYEKGLALTYLSQMGDKRYFPLLLEEAKKLPPNQAREYIMAVAELGGEDSLPYLNELLLNADPFSVGNVVMALPQTGSRRAVPILIEFLKSTNADLCQLALNSLIQLTHRRPLGRTITSPSREYEDWFNWWQRKGQDAPIYGPQYCRADQN